MDSSNGPDETAWMRRIVWVFAICICLEDTFSYDVPDIYTRYLSYL